MLPAPLPLLLLSSIFSDATGGSGWPLPTAAVIVISVERGHPPNWGAVTNTGTCHGERREGGGDRDAEARHGGDLIRVDLCARGGQCRAHA